MMEEVAAQPVETEVQASSNNGSNVHEQPTASSDQFSTTLPQAEFQASSSTGTNHSSMNRQALFPTLESITSPAKIEEQADSFKKGPNMEQGIPLAGSYPQGVLNVVSKPQSPFDFSRLMSTSNSNPQSSFDFSHLSGTSNSNPQSLFSLPHLSGTSNSNPQSLFSLPHLSGTSNSNPQSLFNLHNTSDEPQGLFNLHNTSDKPQGLFNLHNTSDKPQAMVGEEIDTRIHGTTKSIRTEEVQTKISLRSVPPQKPMRDQTLKPDLQSSRKAGRNLQPAQIRALEDQEFESQLQTLYGESVACSSSDSLTVNLSCMHRVILHRLQQQLVKEALRFKFSQPGDDYDLEFTTKYGTWTSEH